MRKIFLLLSVVFCTSVGFSQSQEVSSDSILYLRFEKLEEYIISIDSIRNVKETDDSFLQALILEYS